jgi:hypothetical protein
MRCIIQRLAAILIIFSFVTASIGFSKRVQKYVLKYILQNILQLTTHKYFIHRLTSQCKINGRAIGAPCWPDLGIMVSCIFIFNLFLYDILWYMICVVWWFHFPKFNRPCRPRVKILVSSTRWHIDIGSTGKSSIFVCSHSNVCFVVFPVVIHRSSVVPPSWNARAEPIHSM